MRVLVIGVTGMLGSTVFRLFDDSEDHETWGTMRGAEKRRWFSDSQCDRIMTGVNVLDQDSMVDTFIQTRPDVVINCVGVIKQQDKAHDPISVLPLNSIFPHRLARLCELSKSRLIHISTDCVFSGQDGMYTEESIPDAKDLYGTSKHLGEVTSSENVVTLRTSIIGHELDSRLSLVDWFLSQSGTVKGYSQAIFSGLPTVELALVLRDYVLPKPDLAGLFHVSVDPIDKDSLLRLVASVYGKEIEIVSDDAVRIDRSLDSSRFREATGYRPPPWPQLIERMLENRY